MSSFFNSFLTVFTICELLKAVNEIFFSFPYVLAHLMILTSEKKV